MLVQNATYSWTKLLTAFYVANGVYFYLTGWRRQDSRRTLLAFTSLCCGTVTHYSAAPYAVFLLVHYAIFLLPGRRNWRREGALLAVAAAVVCGPWLGWSSVTYGVRTFTSTSSVADAARLAPGQNVMKIAGNIRDSLVPHLLRGVETGPVAGGLSPGIVRDAAFKAYQSNLLLAFGSAGAFLLAVSFLRRSEGSPGTGPPGAKFWTAFVVFNVAIGIAVHGSRDTVGLAHICLQPLVVIGVALLAARFGEWPIAIRVLAILGMVIDLALGVVLHFWFQSASFGQAQAGGGSLGLSRADLLVGSVYANWKLKEKEGLAFLGDAVAPAAWVILGLLAALLCAMLWSLVREVARPRDRHHATQEPRSR
jgi:hypothetical protein